jgi:hypothetical protein
VNLMTTLAVASQRLLMGSSLADNVSIDDCMAGCGLTNRWSGRVENKVPSSCDGVRAAQLNR